MMLVKLYAIIVIKKATTQIFISKLQKTNNNLNYLYTTD